MMIVGIDVGYSNLKIAYGPHAEHPRTQLRPAGAAPADRFGTCIDGNQHADFLNVLVDDKDFIAGVSSDRAELWSRSLHADYPSSDSYMALFKAGLLLADVQYVDMLVTGLPVSQYFDEKRRSALAKRLAGPHAITRKRSVVVGDVKVIPQPIGGLLDYISQKDVDLEDSRVLVIDPGFFSVDWIVISRGILQQQSSGTNLNASSVVMEEAAKLITKDYGHALSPDSIEDAVRRGKSYISLAGNQVKLAEYLDQSSNKVGSVIAESIQKNLRNETQVSDLVIIVGGGATFFHDALRSAFGSIPVGIPSDPVFSNARGFWTMGASR